MTPLGAFEVLRRLICERQQKLEILNKVMISK